LRSLQVEIFSRNMKPLIFIFLFGAVNSLSPRIRVEEGELIGTTYPLQNGRNLFAFLGIPYANPLTQANRFEVGITQPQIFNSNFLRNFMAQSILFVGTAIFTTMAWNLERNHTAGKLFTIFA